MLVKDVREKVYERIAPFETRVTVEKVEQFLLLNAATGKRLVDGERLGDHDIFQKDHLLLYIIQSVDIVQQGTEAEDKSDSK